MTDQTITVGALRFQLANELGRTQYRCENPEAAGAKFINLSAPQGGDPWVATLRREVQGPTEVGHGPSPLAALRQLVGVCVNLCRKTEEEAEAIMHRARRHVEIASKLGLIVGAAEEAERRKTEGSDGS
jgi:hypothetical protein